MKSWNLIAVFPVTIFCIAIEATVDERAKRLMVGYIADSHDHNAGLLSYLLQRLQNKSEHSLKLDRKDGTRGILIETTHCDNIATTPFNIFPKLISFELLNEPKNHSLYNNHALVKGKIQPQTETPYFPLPTIQEAVQPIETNSFNNALSDRIQDDSSSTYIHNFNTIPQLIQDYVLLEERMQPKSKNQYLNEPLIKETIQPIGEHSSASNMRNSYNNIPDSSQYDALVEEIIQPENQNQYLIIPLTKETDQPNTSINTSPHDYFNVIPLSSQDYPYLPYAQNPEGTPKVLNEFSSLIDTQNQNGFPDGPQKEKNTKSRNKARMGKWWQGYRAIGGTGLASGINIRGGVAPGVKYSGRGAGRLITRGFTTPHGTAKGRRLHGKAAVSSTGFKGGIKRKPKIVHSSKGIKKIRDKIRSFINKFNGKGKGLRSSLNNIKIILPFKLQEVEP